MADVGRHDLVVTERAVLARVLVVAGLDKIAGRKRIVVDNEQGALVEQWQADPECGRVERDEHLGGVAGRGDRPAAEIDLVRRYAEGRADRGTDFCRVVGKGREVGPGQRGGDRELRTHELDAVTRVAGQAYDD